MASTTTYATYPETTDVPTGPYACPVCDQPVRLVSPGWLTFTVDHTAKRAFCSLTVPHLVDPCLDCAELPDRALHHQVLRRIDHGPYDLVYHLPRTAPPNRATKGKPIRVDEYVILRDLPRPVIQRPADWAARRPIDLMGVAGTDLHIGREYLAIALSYVGEPGFCIITWRADEGSAVATVGVRTFDQRRALNDLSILDSELPSTRTHTLESVVEQLVPYLAACRSEGSKPKRDHFITSVLNPPLALRTWTRNTNTWGANWSELVAKHSPRD
jgi:hypothetical protein